MADHAIGADTIRARQHCGGEIRHGRRMRAHIAALVVEKFAIDSKQAPVRIDRGAYMIALLA